MRFDLDRKDYRPIGLDLYQLIYADGDIAPGTAQRFTEQIKKWGIIPGGWVYLNSPGGSLLEGMMLGESIRNAGLYTNIGRRSDSTNMAASSGICASACSLAYLGGNFRYIGNDSVYAVHRFYASPGAQLDSDTTQLLSGLIVSYIQRMGADPEVFRVMTLKGGDEITVIPHDLLRRYHVVTDDVKSTIWSLQNAGGIIYLRVVQEESRGVNKLVFLCEPKFGLVATGFLNTAYAQQIVSQAKHRGWMLDGKFIDIDPKVNTVGPTIENNYVEIETQVPAPLLTRILTAETVGLATEGQDRRLFSGFQIKMDDVGRKSLMEFAQTCHG